MNIKVLQKSINECNRYIAEAKKAIKRLERDELAYISGSKETASARRASMDLTRILVEVRKPWTNE